VGRKAWVMLGILVGVVWGRLRLRLSRCGGDSVGVAFLLPCLSCSHPPIVGAGVKMRSVKLEVI